eukprot:Gb_04602 [translate_table: standard]
MASSCLLVCKIRSPPLCSYEGIPLSTSSASPRLANTKSGKELNYKYGVVPIYKSSAHCPIRVIQNKYCAINSVSIMDQNCLCSFSKQGRKGMLKNKELRSVRLQKLGLVLGATIIHSGLFLSDAASAATLSGLDVILGGIHAVVLAELDPSTTKIAINILGPLFASFNILFILRIVMSWYPQLPVGKFPYVIAYAPTEPFLGPTRKVIPPVGGVDVSPIVCFAIVSLLNEILLGPQGLLVLISQQRP